MTQYGGISGLADSPIQEPTPFGTSTCIERFLGFGRDGIAERTELIEGAPEIIALGTEPLDRMFWLFCAEPYRGHVFVHDHYGRSRWSDEEFLQWPQLEPEIHHYLDLRRTGRLPTKPAGFEDLYLVARTFTDFVMGLRPHAAA